MRPVSTVGSPEHSASATKGTIIAACMAVEMASARAIPSRLGMECRPAARSKSTSWQA